MFLFNTFISYEIKTLMLLRKIIKSPEISKTYRFGFCHFIKRFYSVSKNASMGVREKKQ